MKVLQKLSMDGTDGRETILNRGNYTMRNFVIHSALIVMLGQSRQAD